MATPEVRAFGQLATELEGDSNEPRRIEKRAPGQRLHAAIFHPDRV